MEVSGSDRSAIKRLSAAVAHMEEIFLGVLLIIIVLLIFGNVVSRFFVGKPYAWPDEVATLVHIIGIYIGVAVACRNGSNLRIDLVPQFFKKSKKAYDVISPVGGVVFGMIFIYLSCRFFALERMMLDKSYILSIPIWIVAFIIVVASVLIFLREVERLVAAISHLRGLGENF